MGSSHETLERLRLEVRSKYHTEIDLYEARAEAKQRRIARVPNYFSLPVNSRIHLDDIDSFWKVRNVTRDSESKRGSTSYRHGGQ